MLVEQGHISLEHTDNRVSLLIEVDCLSQNRWIGTVTCLPKAIANDDRVILAGFHFAATQDTAKKRLNTEHGEQFGGGLCFERGVPCQTEIAALDFRGSRRPYPCIPKGVLPFRRGALRVQYYFLRHTANFQIARRDRS